MVVIAGAMLFWFKGLTKDATTIHGQNIALVCNDILFESSYSYGILYLINSGNIDVYSVDFVIYTGDDSEVKNINELSSLWPEKGLTQGEIFSDNIIFNSEVTKVVLIPILKGDEESKEQKKHLCEYQEQVIEIN